MTLHKKTLFKFAAAATLLTIATTSRAQMKLITFDDVPTASLTSYTNGEVTFSYKGPFATIGDTSGPSHTMAYVSPKWLTGDTFGSLTIDFSRYVNSVSFGYALNSQPGNSITDGMTVTAFDGGTKLFQSAYSLTSPQWSAEGFAKISTSGPITELVLTFTSNFNFYGFDPLFGIDNFSYGAVTAASPVPEPETYSVLGCLALIGVVGRKAIRRRK